MTENTETTPAAGTGRILSIDRFRGILIFCMIFFQMIENFDSFGFLARIARHDPAKGIQLLPGMSLADIVSAMFIFAIALTYRRSFENRRELHGRGAAYRHFAGRYLALIGIGTLLKSFDRLADWAGGGSPCMLVSVNVLTAAFAVFAIAWLVTSIKSLRAARPFIKKLLWYDILLLGAVSVLAGVWDEIVIFGGLEPEFVTYSYWVVLQPIGAAGLIALIFIEWKPLARALAGVVLFAAFSVLHELPGNMERFDAITHGGLLASLSWAAMLIFGMVVADLYFKNKKYLFYSLPALAVIGFGGYFLFGEANLGSVSPGYVLLTLFISALGFSISELLSKVKAPVPFFLWWGKSPLLMYIFEFFLVGVPIAVWSGASEAPLWLAILFSLAEVAVMTLIARRLYCQNKIVKV